MKIDKHIYFTNEEYARILDYKEKNKLSFSEAVCFLSISALNSKDILDRINFLESRLNYLIKKINIIYSLEEQIYSDMNFDNLNTNYTHAIACIEQSKRIKNKLDEMGLYSYLVTCKPDKFLSKHGDELLIESHTILVHPCLYNKKISFVIFDPGFRLKNSVLIIDKENSCDKRFYDGIYKIEYKKDNDYPYEIYTNRRTDINRNIYIKDIQRFSDIVSMYLKKVISN